MFGQPPATPGFGPSAAPFGQTPALSSTTPSLFSGAPTAAATANPFGQQPQTPFGQRPPGSSLLGQPAPPAPSNLFGGGLGATPAASAAPTNLFTTAQPSTGLFGQAPATTGGLFGTLQPAQQTSLFGQPPAATSHAPQPAGTLFGQTATGATPGGSLFQPPPAGTSLFNTGQKPPVQPTTGGLFGAPAQPAVTGQPSAQNAVNPSKLKEMKYQELPEEYRKFIDAVESHIKTQIHLANDVAAMVSSNADEIRQAGKRMKDLVGRVTSVKQLIARDGYLNDELREDIRKSLRNGEMVMRFMDRARPPNQPVYLPTEAEAARRYFESLASNLDVKMQTCLQALEELEQVVPSSLQSSVMSIQDMVDTIENQHEVFMAIAAQAASIHEIIERHWQEYRQFKKTYLNSDISTRRMPAQSHTNSDNASLAASMLRPSAPSGQPGQSQQQQTGFGATLGAGQPAPQMQPFFGQGVTPMASTIKKSMRKR